MCSVPGRRICRSAAATRRSWQRQSRDVLETQRPAFRNPVGRIARIAHFLRGKVPSTLLRRIVGRYLGLGRVRL